MMPAFAPGQRWTYHHRTGEEHSTALILRCNETAQGRVISVRLEGLHLANPTASDGETTIIGHLPVAEETLRESVVALIETGVAVPADDGYALWREAFDKGEAGVWTLSLAEIVEAMAQVFAGGPKLNVFSKSGFSK